MFPGVPTAQHRSTLESLRDCFELHGDTTLSEGITRLQQQQAVTKSPDLQQKLSKMLDQLTGMLQTYAGRGLMNLTTTISAALAAVGQVAKQQETAKVRIYLFVSLFAYMFVCCLVVCLILAAVGGAPHH